MTTGARVTAARAAMAEAGLDALVLRPSPDFRFLGGRDGPYLVLTPDALAETADPGRLLPGNARRVGVDPEMRVRELFALAIEAELVPAALALAPLRLRKEPSEIEAVGRAAAAAEAVLGQVRELAWFGATERAMAARLRMLALETGCEEVLSLRVAAGEHTARADHVPGERVINPGDALLVSLCGRWDGYCAEVGRVFAVAEPPEDYEAMYSVVVAAHAAALRAAGRGATAAAVAAAAVDVMDGSGYGSFASDRSGRGVGLGPDEGPWLRPGDATVLEPGMVLCLEPAVYVPDLFGARLADTVVCAPEGPVALSVSPRALRVLDR
ncbi:M24 family metallopeptidase [Nonomuraea cavernae]|uniref:Peptidase M24 domain-containing protein n=1 Tax=Nonomuraea cavernae TaxID=2045107 RepID=A0A917YQK6_9ACTN|nr:M24 family metallopeptidase [Nonomuraea cavernae]MCA2184382.1 M24 family metallopeptidase [Nonomuraea cavernae]GGO63960.1 hypothetical protein GCM10012289_12270 [Nonomuraea cavernae]